MLHLDRTVVVAVVVVPIGVPVVVVVVVVVAAVVVLEFVRDRLMPDELPPESDTSPPAPFGSLEPGTRFVLAFFSNSRIKNFLSSSSSSSIISSMFTSFSTFKFTFTTLLFTLLPAEIELIMEVSGDVFALVVVCPLVETVMLDGVKFLFTPNFFKIEFTLFMLMLPGVFTCFDDSLKSFISRQALALINIPLD
ncbi:hypothetical protein BpHYR1_053041 [Brachionus plicatilis]|uniref:Uncharacterized protein n=1 Tax=Brachionus plicatilis TaxID=10195 RepID=A0A3M7T045_BRAPC|nr:hypothetical protein BpHYR1_053041 [Brachionus plicatilis]